MLRVSVIRRWLAGLALGIALFQGGIAMAADGLVVHAEPRGPAVAIDVRATVAAPHALIWSTLTDYGHLAEFIPGMQSSKITERRGATANVALGTPDSPSAVPSGRRLARPAPRASTASPRG